MGNRIKKRKFSTSRSHARKGDREGQGRTLGNRLMAVANGERAEPYEITKNSGMSRGGGGGTLKGALNRNFI